MRFPIPKLELLLKTYLVLHNAYTYFSHFIVYRLMLNGRNINIKLLPYSVMSDQNQKHKNQDRTTSTEGDGTTNKPTELKAGRPAS